MLERTTVGDVLVSYMLLQHQRQWAKNLKMLSKYTCYYVSSNNVGRPSAFLGRDVLMLTKLTNPFIPYMHSLALLGHTYQQ